MKVMAAMRVQVLGDDTISSQARTYAQYRVFAALAHGAENLRCATVVLWSLDRSDACEAVSCTVSVDVEGGGSFRIRARGAHAYAAINRAVERLRSLIGPTAAAKLAS
jgi:ribosome-associated translation inhibitor RaiA